jgi:ribosomal protein S18 acetylase RimI-like enzyme
LASAPDAGVERALAFLRALEDRAATRTVPAGWGTALFHDELPYVYDRNFLRVEREVEPGQLPELLAAADRLQGGAGLVHRRLVFDSQDCRKHAAALLGAGYQLGGLLVMAARSDCDRPPPAGGAREVELSDIEGAKRRFLSGEPFGGDPETVRQLLVNDALLVEVADGRTFAAFDGGQVASYCRLYRDGRVFQIEDVGTLPALRGRGHARAVVAAARMAAEDAGAELVFLTARDDDWPKELYAKLGFDPIGVRCEATRLPGGRRPG